MQKIMNSDSKLSFDTHAVINLLRELIVSALVGLLFGLLGLGLAVLIFAKAFTFSVVLAWLSRSYEYWLPRGFDGLLIPVTTATISLATLHRIIDRVQWQKSWLRFTLLSQVIPIFLLLLYWSWHPYTSPARVLYATQWFLKYVPPLALILFWVMFIAFAGLSLLLAPQVRRMRIIALTASVGAFAMLYQIAFLCYEIGSILAQSGN